MRKPRVLMLVDSLADEAGGAERFAVGLALALPKDDFAVGICVTRTARGGMPNELDAAGIPWLELGRTGRSDIMPLRRLGAVLRTVDLLHAHKFGSNVWGSVVGRAAGVPVIVAHEHTWSYEGQPLRRLLDGQLVGRLADSFVSVSNADRRRMIDLEGVPPEKTITIPTGFVPRMEPSAGDLRSELGIASGAPVVGTICSVRPQKALEVLLEALAIVQRGRPDTHLVVVGDGPARPGLEAHAESLGVSRVHFTGTRTDLAVIFEAFDVAVMSSDFEGLPLFAFECMNYRTPLVATAVGGLPDLVRQEETGLLVPPRDPGALARALEALLSDPGRRARMASAAHEQLPDYSMERIAARFAELYGDLLARRGGGRRLRAPGPSSPAAPELNGSARRPGSRRLADP